MNYYERHIGDYLKDTAHLSLLEHGVYSRMLDVYYTREEGLPDAQVMRLVGARTKEEREAVAAVLDEFFKKNGDGTWHQDRCDREISRYLDKSGKAKKAAQASVESRQGRPNGSGASVKPPLNERQTDVERTLSGRSTTRARVPSNQTPDTSNQLNNRETTSLSSTATPSTAGQLPNCPYAEVVGLYHDKLPVLPRCKLLPETRKRAIQRVWKWVLTSKKPDKTRRATTAEEALAWFGMYFDRAGANDFIMGRTRKSDSHANWKADLDFLLSDKGMKQVIEKTETD